MERKDRNEQDLLAYYDALPDWAKQEVVVLAQRAAMGELDFGGYASAFGDLMRRVERERDGRPKYVLH